MTTVAEALIVAEVPVQPIRRGAVELQQAYVERLLNSAFFETRPIDAPVARRAAEIRARFNVRIPDALQLATALVEGCEAFLTNDSNLKRVSDIRMLVLDDLD